MPVEAGWTASLTPFDGSPVRSLPLAKRPDLRRTWRVKYDTCLLSLNNEAGGEPVQKKDRVFVYKDGVLQFHGLVIHQPRGRLAQGGYQVDVLAASMPFLLWKKLTEAWSIQGSDLDVAKGLLLKDRIRVYPFDDAAEFASLSNASVHDGGVFLVTSPAVAVTAAVTVLAEITGIKLEAEEDQSENVDVVEDFLTSTLINSGTSTAGIWDSIYARVRLPDRVTDVAEAFADATGISSGDNYVVAGGQLRIGGNLATEDFEGSTYRSKANYASGDVVIHSTGTQPPTGQEPLPTYLNFGTSSAKGRPREVVFVDGQHYLHDCTLNDSHNSTPNPTVRSFYPFNPDTKAVGAAVDVATVFPGIDANNPKDYNTLCVLFLGLQADGYQYLFIGHNGGSGTGDDDLGRIYRKLPADTNWTVRDSAYPIYEFSAPLVDAPYYIQTFNHKGKTFVGVMPLDGIDGGGNIYFNRISRFDTAGTGSFNNVWVGNNTNSDTSQFGRGFFFATDTKAYWVRQNLSDFLQVYPFTTSATAGWTASGTFTSTTTQGGWNSPEDVSQGLVMLEVSGPRLRLVQYTTANGFRIMGSLLAPVKEVTGTGHGSFSGYVESESNVVQVLQSSGTKTGTVTFDVYKVASKAAYFRIGTAFQFRLDESGRLHYYNSSGVLTPLSNVSTLGNAAWGAVKLEYDTSNANPALWTCVCYVAGVNVGTATYRLANVADRLLEWGHRYDATQEFGVDSIVAWSRIGATTNLSASATLTSRSVTYDIYRLWLETTQTTPGASTIAYEVSVDGGLTFRPVTRTTNPATPIYTVFPGTQTPNLILRVTLTTPNGADQPTVDLATLHVANGYNPTTATYESLDLTTASVIGESITIKAESIVSLPAGTSISWFVSSNGGANYTVHPGPGSTVSIPSGQRGTDVRVRAIMSTTNANVTPSIYRLELTVGNPTGTTTITYEVSRDGGTTWHSVANGAEVDLTSFTGEASRKTMQARITMTTSDPLVTPSVRSLKLTARTIGLTYVRLGAEPGEAVQSTSSFPIDYFYQPCGPALESLVAATDVDAWWRLDPATGIYYLNYNVARPAATSTGRVGIEVEGVEFVRDASKYADRFVLVGKRAA